MALGESLLSRSWRSACGLAFLTFVVIQVLFQIDYLYSSTPICNGEKSASWMSSLKLIEVTAFYCQTFIVIFYRMFSFSSNSYERSDKFVGAQAVTVTVTFLAGTSSLLAIWTWGGVCKDAFGVISPGVQSGEWISLVPLLVYTVLAFDDKKNLNRTEIMAMASIIITMLCSFFMILPISYSLSMFFFILAWFTSFTCALCMYVALRGRSLAIEVLNQPIDNNITQNNTSSHHILYAHSRKKLAITLFWLLALFPLVHLIAIFYPMSIETSFVLFSICDMLAKLIFVSVCMTTQTDVLHTIIEAQQEEAIEKRRVFLRWIMHEIRVPLNSISMGIDVMDLACEDMSVSSTSLSNILINRHFTDIDTNNTTLAMIKDATISMSNTLDDILVIQKFEEGAFKLQLSSFSLEDTLQRAIHFLQTNLIDYNISVQLKFLSSLPETVKGDSHRIEQTLRSLLLFAKNNILSYITSTDSNYETEGIITLSVKVINTRINRKNITRQSILPNISPSNRGTRPLLSPSPISTDESLRMFSSSLEVETPINIEFTIIDNGPSISIERQACLFKPFSLLRVNEDDMNNSISSVEERLPEIVISNSTRNINTCNNNNNNIFNNNNNNNNLRLRCRSHSNENQTSTSFPRRSSELSHNSTSLPINNRSSNDLLSSDYTTNYTPNKIFTTGKDNISLFVSKQIVELHGGEILYIPTDSNVGNRIQIIIPMIPVNVIEEQSIILENNQSEQSQHSFIDDKQLNLSVPNEKCDISPVKKLEESEDETEEVLHYNSNPMLQKCALIVDDVLSCRKLLGCLLKKYGIEHVEAKDGVEAFTTVQSDINKFHIIFMDNSMPRMSGVQASRACRQIGFKHIIIGVTGNAMDDDLAEFLSAGADIVCTKPLKNDQLKMLLQYFYKRGYTSDKNKKYRLAGDRVEREME